MSELHRCFWIGTDPLMIDYHDHEWGIPVHNDHKLFEFLILEWAQAGLSWRTILHRREGYRRAFDDFDIERIMRYDETKIEALMQDPGIIRNRLKIESVQLNARAFLAVQREFGSFDAYVWSFTHGKMIVQRPCDRSEYRATSPESDAMSRDMKRRGFKFMGSTICYAFMQAVGMVDEHEAGCFRAR